MHQCINAKIWRFEDALNLTRHYFKNLSEIRGI
jgi:hypothetical protein